MRKLPDFPWDRLAPHKARAGQHPDGIVDLSVGTPVDPVPALIQEALRAGSDAPGYPFTHGTPALREAAAGWMARRLGVAGASVVLTPEGGAAELIRRERPRLVWLNSPANPHGRVAGVAELRGVVEAAREVGTVLVSDECYIELGWTEPAPVSLLHPSVC